MNNINKLQNWFLHIDLDAFFASVEQLDNPEYRGLPVIVGGRKDDKRGVVSTASYEARKFGVHSAMPIFQALRLCPNGIYLRTRMKRYAELSYEIMTIFKDFSPVVEQMSIDEAFVDLTGTERLFGPPEETAMKIKKVVKEKTGLTVSIGLATTKYLAKIASGYSKPDGFYYIKPGQEKNFMLSLPLKKVWGIGPKAIERLKRAGIHSTQDIYEKPIELLTFLFGNSMATFLFNVVRGVENEVFSRKQKSHSISAESTFAEDITDIYTAETELLELAHGVMFRLLKEEKFSRTVTVKIKYDDFTTVSIQKTLDNNILTLDNFFETIKYLFEEKYQKGRGIRLLGVGFDKVENNDRPAQQSLFGNKEDKKQAVEKAILNLNKKHPEIKIQKARLLKAVIIIFITISYFSPIKNNYQKLYAEDFQHLSSNEKMLAQQENSENNNEENENSGAIFNWNINDKTKVDFKIDGHWQGNMVGSLISTFNKDMPAFFDAPIPVFKQDIELYTLFTLNKKWYFEANFADNFANNTLTLGYNGDKYFRSGKLSNRNITMPNTYSAEQFGFGLSGGTNQAPGFTAHWQAPSDKWSGDFLIRYDMTIPKSATFYGKNKVTDTIIAPENYLHSHSFTFPELSKSELKEIKDIYIESPDGNFKDKNDRTFKKLSYSDYYYSEINNILYLSSSITNNKDDAIPVILITFISPSSTDKIISETGNYTDSNSFAGEIQSLFNKSSKKYDLTDFSYPLKDEINTETALVIQNSEGFSPYLVANTYDCGTNKNIEVSVISKITKKNYYDYIVELENTSFITPYEDFFDKEHVYAKINNSSNNNRYPFIETHPDIYLNIQSDIEEVLQVRTFNKVSKINIGQKVSAGTINVVKNGAYTSDFIYNKNTGDIILSEPINNNDQIRILWEEEASNFAQGALSMGIGFQLNILPELKWDIALTAKKPLIFDNSFSTPDNIKSSFLALSTGLDFSKNNFSINDKAAFSIKKQNDSDKLLVSTQDNFLPKTYKQKINSGYETKADIYLNNNILYQKDNYTIKSHEGEKDNILQGVRIPLQWDFSTSQNNSSWAAVDLKLEGGKDLKNSTKLNFDLYIPDISPDFIKYYNLYIQLGIKAGSSFSSSNKNLPIFDITNKIDVNNSQWQTISINLSDKDRSFLTSNNDIRIIIKKKNSTELVDSKLLKSKIYIGNYTTVLKSIFTESDENIIINTTTVPSSERFFSSEIKWITDIDTIPTNSIITATTNFIPSDFTPYKTIKFKFAYENRSSTSKNAISILPNLSITLDSHNTSNSNSRNIAIKLDLYNISSYIENIKKYHTVSIKKETSTDYSVFIDDIKLNNNDYKIYVNKSVVPSRAKYEINTIIENKIINNGSFYVDNITFEESDYIYTIDNSINASYKKDDILEINKYPILSNGFITTSSSQKFTDANATVISSLNSGITITGVSLQADMLLKQSDFQNIGHNINTTTPILNVFSFYESYRWDKQNDFLHKSNNFCLELNYIDIPVSISSTLLAKEDNIQKEQKHETALKSNFSIKNTVLDFSTSLMTNQKINMFKNDFYSSVTNNNYFYSWYDITKFQFSTGNNNASSRNTKILNTFTIDIFNNFIKPSIEYSLSASYENIKNPLFTDKVSLKLSIPMTFENHFISFSLSKTGGDISHIKSYTKNNNAYFTDLDKLFKLQPERQWFYTTIPFYELFDQKMSSKIKGNYSSKYEIKYSKNLFNSFKDLYIPSSATFAIIRDIKSKNYFSDSYQIKTTIESQSINNFGRNSEKQIFKWFNEEEITSGITGILKIPVDNPKNTTYKLTSYMQILLIIKENSSVNNIFDFTFEQNKDWRIKNTISYSRPGKNSLITDIASFFSEKTKDLDFTITRKDSFTFSIGMANKINRQQYDYNHFLDIGFLKYFTITNGIGATLNYVENSSSQLSINYSLGGKVSF